MSVKTALTALMEPIFGTRAWWNHMPEGTAWGEASPPFLIMSQIGGKDQWYVDNQNKKSHQHVRMRFEVYSPDRLVSDALIEQVADALRLADFPVEPYGDATDEYVDDFKSEKSWRDFGIWHPY